MEPSDQFHSIVYRGVFITDHPQVFSISLFVAVLCLCIVVGHLLEEYRWVNESITSILIGLATGIIILFLSKGTSSHILRFDEEFFFIYLLPPIIFNAGFQVKKKQFFQNFFTIMLFGVVGVFISSAIIAAGCWWLFPKIGFHGLEARDYLALGTIFASTDTVCTLQVLCQDETPLLYSLVFGEGVVNDATSVVLFRAVQKLDVSRLNGWVAGHIFGDFLYLFSTSTALGIAMGLLTAYGMKTLYFGRHSTDREIAVMVLMAYLSYTLAELLRLSGILTVFFCGIVMSHYAWHNVSEHSRITARAKLIIFGLAGVFSHLNGVALYAFLSFARIFSKLYEAIPTQRRVEVRMAYGHETIVDLFTSLGFHAISQVLLYWHIFATMSFIAETFIFLYVGMDALDMEKWRVTKTSFGTSVGIYCTILSLVLLGRAAFVFPLSSLSNYMSTGRRVLTFKHQIAQFRGKIGRFGDLTAQTAVGIMNPGYFLNPRFHYQEGFEFSDNIRSGVTKVIERLAPNVTFAIEATREVVIWWAGLMRGAVSMALAFNQFTASGVTWDPAYATMICSTIIVVLFSTLVFGFLTRPLVNVLLPNRNQHHPSSPKEELYLPLLDFQESTATNILRAKNSLSMLLERPAHTIHFYWRKFDDAYMRPIFGGPT